MLRSWQSPPVLGFGTKKPDRAIKGYPAHVSMSSLSPEGIRTAEVHEELGPEYSDAEVASFLEKVDKDIAGV
jgi:hypothetical protein